MRWLNWSHAIIGFLIGVALVLYIRLDKGGAEPVSGSYEVVEVQTDD